MNSSVVKAKMPAWLMAVGIVMVACNLRPALVSLSPVLNEIMADLDISAGAVGMLTTASVLLLGLCSPFAPGMARRFGSELVILGALVLLTIGVGLRYFANLPSLMLSSVLCGVGVCMGNVLIPAIIKRDFPAHVPSMTGLYTMCLCASAAVPAGVTAPLAERFGWPLALASWAGFALVGIVVWLPQVRHQRGLAVQARARVTGLWKDPLAWQVTAYMGLQSALAYAVMTWFVPVLRDRGLDPVTAGIVVSVAVFVQTPAAMLAPVIGARGRDQRMTILVSAAIGLAGMMGFIFAPLSTIWIWAVAVGIGQGATFALALVLIPLRSPDGAVAAQLSSMVQTTGYLIAASGPLVAGLLHDWTGGWTEVGWFLLAMAIASAIAGWGAGRTKFVKSESVPG